MKFEALLERFHQFPVIDTSILANFVGELSPSSLAVQVSRWVKTGKLIQLKRGFYLLSEAYRKIQPSEFYIANILKFPSYISLEKAMEFYGLIPEAVNSLTSVTTKRPEVLQNSLGRYDYRHIKSSLFWGYRSLRINEQTVFVATPEKALLDYFYLKNIKVTQDYLKEMRFQNFEMIQFKKLHTFALRFKKQFLIEAVTTLENYMCEYKKGKKSA